MHIHFAKPLFNISLELAVKVRLIMIDFHICIRVTAQKRPKLLYGFFADIKPGALYDPFNGAINALLIFSVSYVIQTFPAWFKSHVIPLTILADVD